MSRDARIQQGFTSDTPSEAGVYIMSCDEIDYEMSIVEIADSDFGLLVKDPEVGHYPIESYDLTDLLWLKGSHV